MDSVLTPVKFEETHLMVLDQRLLPTQTVYRKRETLEQVFHSIRDMECRGAPLIGITAAYGMYLSVAPVAFSSGEALLAALRQNAQYLNQARPTAVNLSWATARMVHTAFQNREKAPEQIKHMLRQQAVEINQEDVEICRNIGESLLPLLEKNMGLLTHCNAGALATYQYGTATSPMYLGQQRGYGFHVFVDETRPYNQGARLTAFELMHAGIDTTLICDNMAGMVLSQGRVGAVIVGCDRLAANGDAANKIGTLSLSILAKFFGVPFYIAAPTPTIDLQTPTGAQIPIEERSPQEITHFQGVRVTPENVRVYNPAFDVTPAANITAIATEKGMVFPPFPENLAALFEKE
ncbi:MAG TPA: S-methyl-5-thioribose-1-phosphate isomerase [Thermotogota bacterium]|nr:S-methyl-5-thioribose-1-phosphate isomerase [Thermotogota bacterium]HRW91771.1 S-methyl-5-thioribose-1-phosphate isomerase [Thermotogota bacterium]